MIHYDPHRWLDHFFDVRGSLVKEISGRVTVCVLWSALIVYLHKNVTPLGISSILHSLVGLALGLLLVVRTNSSYERFWEGRKLWGGIVNDTRNLIRSAVVHLHSEPEVLERLTRWTAVFPWAVMNVLRGNPGLGPLQTELPPPAAADAASAQHTGLAVAGEMSACLQEARNRGTITDVVQVYLDQNVHNLVNYMGGCERIRKTPLPFAYVVHLRRSLILYCFTLPFAIVEAFGWGTVAGVLLLSYTFLGVEEIGVTIEGPFGHDENDLPLEDIAATIHDNLYSMAGIQKLDREVLPKGL